MSPASSRTTSPRARSPSRTRHPPSPTGGAGSTTWPGLGLPFLVAKAGGEVAGYAYACPWRAKPAYRRTVEDSVYLAPDRLGQGLGRSLLAALLAGCTEAGVRQVVAVIADTGGDASVALHRSLGFAHAGRRWPRAQARQWIDTVLMQRDLTGAGG